MFLTLAFLIIIFYTQGAFLYKYDDFSEYGIIPKLIFFENYLPIYIDYLDKGTHSKVNIISIYQYFFLKNSALEFQENSLLVVNNFFKILLIINLFSYINYSRLKYFIIFIIFYFLIYSLSTGFDRLYVDSIIALIIPNLFLIFFNNNKKLDYLLFTLLFITIPCLKFSGIIIVLGISAIFLLYNFFVKKNDKSIIVIICLFISFFINQFHHSSFANFNNNINEDFKKKFYQNRDQFQNYTYESKHILKKTDQKIFEKEIILEIVSANFKKLSSDGIYHSKTFLILNKIFDKLKLPLNLKEYPINLYVWISLILIMSFFIKANLKYLNIISILYILFIFSYFFILILWAMVNNLINNDYTIAQSWQRHLGVLLLGYILFLLVNILRYKRLDYLKLIIVGLIIMMISVPNSLKNFFSLEFIITEKYWKETFEMRNEIKYLSESIEQKIPKYSKLIVCNPIKYNGYFYPILKYELININTIKNNDYRLETFINKKSVKNLKNKLFILVSDKQDVDFEISKIFDLDKTQIKLVSIIDKSFLYEIKNI